jgi:ubiquinone/menaquinone biosynthesis C-methylase UbiE
MVEEFDYDRLMHRTYVQGRQLSTSTLDQWMEVVSAFVHADPPLTILDLGSGSGRFSIPLADRFGAWVVGVEPSVKMREQAPQTVNAGRIAYVGGKAEDLPLASGSVDAVFASMVVHYFADLSRVAHEVARVLRPGGKVLVRNSFRGRLESVQYHRYFPRARTLDESRLPSIETVEAAFASAGLQPGAHQVVRQQIDASLSAHLDRLRLRAISSLALLSDAEYERGIARLERVVLEEGGAEPVWEEIDLLVFTRGD